MEIKTQSVGDHIPNTHVGDCVGGTDIDHAETHEYLGATLTALIS